MKQFLMMIAMLGAFSAMAIDAGRVDVSGTKAGITFQKGAANCNVEYASWLKDANQTLLSANLAPTEGDYRTMEFVFIPDKSGVVEISVKGQWDADVNNRQYYLFRKVTVNDDLLKNPDFSQKNDDGKAAAWWYDKAAIVDDNGTTAAKVNHDNAIIGWVNVEAGKEYKVKADFKRAQ